MHSHSLDIYLFPNQAHFNSTFTLQVYVETLYSILIIIYASVPSQILMQSNLDYHQWQLLLEDSRVDS